MIAEEQEQERLDMEGMHSALALMRSGGLGRIAEANERQTAVAAEAARWTHLQAMRMQGRYAGGSTSRPQCNLDYLRFH